MKQNSGIVFLLLASVAMIVLEEQRVSGMTMPDVVQQCDPEILAQTDNPKIRKICSFLQNYAIAMQQYNREGVLYPDMMENGVKRQDVDHVFLRFGRRRR